MTLTKGRIERTGQVVFHDATLSIWEDGISAAQATDGYAGAERWERQFKRDVFARIVQTLHRIGWEVGPQTYIFTGNNARYCRKGDLQADLILSGRHIELKFFQNVNAPNRADNGGRYQRDQEQHMPYLLRLEMERSRRRIRDYLCNVFTDYVFDPPKISSPNPDPLAYFNDSWDSERDKKRGTHRFNRGADGWPNDAEISSRDRTDRDGSVLHHGDVRWLRDRGGRLQRGRVYGGVGGRWLFVYGPGARDFTHEEACRFFTYRCDKTPRKLVEAGIRRRRLEKELQVAIAAMKFERAAVLRDILFPGEQPLFNVWSNRHQLYHCTGFCGYTTDRSQAGKFTESEVRGWNDGDNRVFPIASEPREAA